MTVSASTRLSSLPACGVLRVCRGSRLQTLAIGGLKVSDGLDRSLIMDNAKGQFNHEFQRIRIALDLLQ